MNNFTGAILTKLAIHKVGNKSKNEGYHLSKTAISVDDDLIRDLLMRYFLSSFKSAEYYTFGHETDLELNDVFQFAALLFSDITTFYENSVSIAQHLYEQSAHPKIKSGEIYVTYFENCVVDNEVVDAIGIFKSESKSSFLKVFAGSDNFEVEQDEGIDINKLDKGCMIYNTEREQGFKISIVDNVGRGDEAQFWKNDFLGLKPREDSFHFTQNYMDLCKNFVENKLTEEFNVSKTDQVDFLNKSAKFFEEKDVFDINQYSKEVIGQEDIETSFREYKEKFEQQNDLSLCDEFDISEQAVKNKKRIFKSIIKLDKNFHIYLHGNKDLIERGFDETSGLNYYKLFFRTEC